MRIIYSLKILFLSAVLGLAGLMGFTSNYFDVNSGDDFLPVKSISFNQSFNNNNSQFRRLEKIVNFESIEDASILKREIGTINNDFEKNYLLALLEKRAGNYGKAYSLLAGQLGNSPSYLPYFEELVNIANYTQNLDKLHNQIIKNSTVDNKFILYINGLIAYKKGDYKNAIKNFNELTKIDNQNGRFIYWLGILHSKNGDYEKSLSLLSKADSLTQTGDYIKPEISLYTGSIYFLSSNYVEAQNYYEEALKRAAVSGNKKSEIRAIASIALIKDETGDINGARTDLKKALQTARSIQDAELQAYLYSELGVSYTFTNHLLSARKNYDKSYRLYLKLNNIERLSYLSSNLGSINLQTANYKAAIKFYDDGLKYAGDNKLGQILNLTGLADVYANMANYAKALEFYKKAKGISESIKNVQAEAKIEIGIGSLFFNINRAKGSLKFLNEARKKLNPDEMPFLSSDIYLKLGIVHTSLKNFRKAASYFNKALKLTDKTGDLYFNLVTKTEYANSLLKSNKPEQAKQLLNTAYKTSKKYELNQLIGLQQLYLGKINVKQKHYDAAVTFFEDAITNSKAANDFNNEIEAMYSLANLYNKQKVYDKAEWKYKNAIDLIERLSKALFVNSNIQISHFSSFNNVYESIIDFYLKRGNEQLAFSYLERSRSRNTLQNLVNLKLISSDIDEEKINKYIDLQWMIESNLYDGQQLDELKNELKDLRQEIAGTDENLSQILDGQLTLPVANIQESLNNNETIISYFTTKQYTEIFVVSQNRFSTVRIDGGKERIKEIAQKISPFYEPKLRSDELFVNQDLFAFNAKYAGNLYNKFFKPVLENISSDKEIIFSLPEELLQIPLEFLVTNWDDEQSPFYYNNKIFLVEKRTISYTPSASIYVKQKHLKKNFNGPILLVGDPDISDEDFTISYRTALLEDNSFSTRNIELFPLAYSKDEIKGIDKLVSNDVMLLSGEATETNVKKNAPGSKIIHLSTHSFLFKDQPLIILSRQSDFAEDGFLEMGEIVQMNLNSDLVVLSSCRSGLGKIDEAEGILGMQKSFFDAGAKSIVVSLWDVNDKYTSIFMKSFYKFLSDGKNKTEALRAAKINFIKKNSPNPYYWSAFILSGDISTVELQSKPSDIYYYMLGIFILIAAGFVLKQRYELYQKTQLQSGLNG